MLTLASYHGHADIVKLLFDRNVEFQQKSMEYAISIGSVVITYRHAVV